MMTRLPPHLATHTGPAPDARPGQVTQAGQVARAGRRTIVGVKATLRRDLKAALADIRPADRTARSHAAAERLVTLDLWRRARVVLLYRALPTEVDTTTLALRAWQAGKTVAMPKVSWGQKRLLPLEIRSLTDAAWADAHAGFRHAGFLGETPAADAPSSAATHEPIEGNPVPLDTIDLVIVPGLGFDTRGGRLGRGMGFYDRFLSQPDFAGTICGLAYDEQVLTEFLPVEPHDIRLHWLVTESRTREFPGVGVGGIGGGGGGGGGTSG